MTTTATAVNEVTSRVERERARKRRYQYRIKYIGCISGTGQVRAYVPEVGPHGTGVGTYQGTRGFIPQIFETAYTHDSSIIGKPCDRPDGCASYHSILDEIVRVNKLKGTYKKDDREIYEVPAGTRFEKCVDNETEVWGTTDGYTHLLRKSTGELCPFPDPSPFLTETSINYPAITKEEAEKRLGRRIVFVNGGER